MQNAEAREIALIAPRRHEHGWETESSHRTLEGVVVYVRCADCGTRRVDLVAASAPPRALSREI
ncbi:hypothetical protein [Microbacterium stercoris]|uniref:Uncharacterized protein n=1 Tax=Microbacterium stercoris TaxID=2820289 RepID=A0A939TQ59_9MICO|nr:hypothetical protein [Microbacterium stercoris]MBO3662806.1 hypothetical protein [Microbacterium stercoris]